MKVFMNLYNDNRSNFMYTSSTYAIKGSGIKTFYKVLQL